MYRQKLAKCNQFSYSFFVSEPSDAGIIPPQFRKPQQQPPLQQQQPQSLLASTSSVNHAPVETNNSTASDKKQPHQWSSNPVEEWAKEQVTYCFVPQIQVIKQEELHFESLKLLALFFY